MVVIVVVTTTSRKNAISDHLRLTTMCHRSRKWIASSWGAASSGSKTTVETSVPAPPAARSGRCAAVGCPD